MAGTLPSNQPPSNQPPSDGGSVDHLLAGAPRASDMMSWIETVVAAGVRRPAYPADDEVARWAAALLTSFGLHGVTCDEVPVVRWEEGPTTLAVRRGPGHRWHDVDAFPMPHTADGALIAPLVPADRATAGSVVARQVDLPAVPNADLRSMALDAFDPEDHFASSTHILPFGLDVHDVAGTATAAGAAGFVGILGEHYWESNRYYLPYDGKPRSTPAVWVAPDAGATVLECAEVGGECRLQTTSWSRPATTVNVLGALPGRSDSWVVIGSHHDAPWASAVEDASGIALVLAQARLWSQVPATDRPHNMLFLLNGAHMFGGAGVQSFLRDHGDLLRNVVLAVHLEHAAAASAVVDGRLVALDQPEDRWWFASRHPVLQELLLASIKAESLRRSMVFAPDAFMEHPPTDGGPFHLFGVPLVNFLPAPRYLFDAADTVALVHRASLLPVTRAVVRLIAGLYGMDPTTLR